MATQVKVGFVLLSNSGNPIPSTRIAALNMFPFMRAAGIEPHIVFEPEQGTEAPDLTGLVARVIRDNFDVIVFQKVHGRSVESTAMELRTAGIKTIYLVCDLIETSMASITDATIVVTNYLRSLYPVWLQAKIHVVHDGIEHPETSKTDWGTHRGSRVRPLRAVLVTSAYMDCLPAIDSLPSWLQIIIVGRYLPRNRIFHRFQQALWAVANRESLPDKIRCISFFTSKQVRRIPWSQETVYTEMAMADIGIIPVDTTVVAMSDGLVPSWKIKSENRLSMKMSISLPVIATEIPSYTPLIEQGVSGFLAQNNSDWIDAFEVLRDPAARERIGRSGRKAVEKQYSMQEQARLFILILNAVINNATVGTERHFQDT